MKKLHYKSSIFWLEWERLFHFHKTIETVSNRGLKKTAESVLAMSTAEVLPYEVLTPVALGSFYSIPI